MNLRSKEYVFANQQLTKEQYEKKLKEMSIDSYTKCSAYKRAFPDYCSKQIHRHMQGSNNENVSGDHIFNSKNIYRSFNIEDSWDVRYSEILIYARDCMDVSSFGEKIEHMYECCTAGLESQSCYFCFTPVVNSSELFYCDVSYSSKHCFGCVGLHRNEYCILNKQYTKEQYEELVPKIIEHMKKTKEWGEFFSHELSPFSYNETVAMDFFPLTKKEVLAKKWRWHNHDEKKDQYLGPTINLPDSITEVPTEITKKILTCEATGKQFKIVPKELAFYKNQTIPVPLLCPDERHRYRMERKSKRCIHTRTCSKCQKLIETTYTPDRPEKVYCEECYLSTIYS